MHCGKVLILANVPGRKKITQESPQEDIHAQYIEDIKYLSTSLLLEVNFLAEPFPQCTRYIYILIYIKGSKFWQTAVYIYIYIYMN